jgi:nucleoside phosphorylase
MRPKDIQYETLSTQEAELIKPDHNVLVVTATNIETHFLHRKMKPSINSAKIRKVYNENQTYYVGVLGEYEIAHVQSAIGSITRDGSILTVQKAIEFWQPKAVVMVGIAFGKDKKKLQIGDVLVSKSITAYDIVRKGNEQDQYRGDTIPSGKILFNRFNNVRDWKHTLPWKKKRAQIICGQILSGEALVDNLEFRDQLFKQFPDAKGGEMEGVGLYTAAQDQGIEWILIKSICDFGDGNKKKNKDKYQRIAAESSTSLCHKVFTDREAFKALDVLPVLKGTAPFRESLVGSNIVEEDIESQALHIRYKVQYVKYYLLRKQDKSITQILNISNLLISGKAGMGKTNLVLHYLLHRQSQYCYIDLSPNPCTDLDLIFSDIYDELFARFRSQLTEAGFVPLSATKDANAISDLLCHLARMKKIIIVIDELGFSTVQMAQRFIEKLVKLMNYHFSRQSISPQVKFVIAMLGSPDKFGKTLKGKGREYFQTIHLDKWTNVDMRRLMELLLRALNISPTKKEKDLILKTSAGSPRILKRLLKKKRLFPDWSVSRIIEEVIGEDI